MNSGPSLHFGCHWLARTAGFLVATVFVVILAITLVNNNYAAFVWVMFPTVPFVWEAISCFRFQVIVDDGGLLVLDNLWKFHRRYRWEELKAVKTVVNPVALTQYLVFSHDTHKRPIYITRAVKGYRQLLRAILARAHETTEIDLKVVQDCGFLESPEGRQRLSKIREQSSRSPS